MWVATVRGIVGPIARDAYRLVGCLVVGRNVPRKSAELSWWEAGWKLVGRWVDVGWQLAAGLGAGCELIGSW